jgi:hypothetical protein
MPSPPTLSQRERGPQIALPPGLLVLGTATRQG